MLDFASLKGLYFGWLTVLAIAIGAVLLGVLFYAVGRHFGWWKAFAYAEAKGKAIDRLRRWGWVAVLTTVPAALFCPHSIIALGLALIANAVAIYQAGRVRSGSEAYGVLLVYLLAAILLVLGVIVLLFGLVYGGPQ